MKSLPAVLLARRVTGWKVEHVSDSVGEADKEFERLAHSPDLGIVELALFAKVHPRRHRRIGPVHASMEAVATAPERVEKTADIKPRPVTILRRGR